MDYQLTSFFQPSNAEKGSRQKIIGSKKGEELSRSGQVVSSSPLFINQMFASSAEY
jgi:hypothetical protein